MWGAVRQDWPDRLYCKVQLQPRQGPVRTPEKISKQPEEKPHANNGIGEDL